MFRVQINLSEDQLAAAQSAATRLGLSVEEFATLATLEKLAINETIPWMQYAGMVESGDPLSSQRIDKSVYGQKP